MTTSNADAPKDSPSVYAKPDHWTGQQYPRIEHVPPYVSNEDADDAIELSALAGLVLDPWQERVFRHSLGLDPLGKWAAFEVACIVPRQNGKGSIIEARELAGLFLFGERLIIHTAHEFKTAIEAFKRIEKLIRQTPQLVRQVRGFKGDPMGAMSGIKTGNGFQSITLANGAQIQFLARSTGSGRGFTADLVILDEAYALTPLQVDAIVPTLSARTVEHNPQLWYLSSAGLADSEVLASIKERGESEDPGGIYYAEFSVDETAKGFDPADPAQWALANPAAGRRIRFEAIANEYRSMGLEGFLRERLGVWAKVGGVSVFPPGYWEQGQLPDDDEDEELPTIVALAVDVPPDRASASIGMAGYLPDGSTYAELVDRRLGLDWVVPAILTLRENLGPVAIVVDAGGAAGALLPAFKAAKIRTLQLTAREYGQACGKFFDLVMQGGLVHIGQEELADAVAGARRSPMGDSLWRWSRKDSLVDISPLCAITLAVLGLERRGNRKRKAAAGSPNSARKAVLL